MYHCYSTENCLTISNKQTKIHISDCWLVEVISVEFGTIFNMRESSIEMEPTSRYHILFQFFLSSELSIQQSFIAYDMTAL